MERNYCPCVTCNKTTSCIALSICNFFCGSFFFVYWMKCFPIWYTPEQISSISALWQKYFHWLKYFKPVFLTFSDYCLFWINLSHATSLFIYLVNADSYFVCACRLKSVKICRTFVKVLPWDSLCQRTQLYLMIEWSLLLLGVGWFLLMKWACQYPKVERDNFVEYVNVWKRRIVF